MCDCCSLGSAVSTGSGPPSFLPPPPPPVPTTEEDEECEYDDTTGIQMVSYI